MPAGLAPPMQLKIMRASASTRRVQLHSYIMSRKPKKGNEIVVQFVVDLGVLRARLAVDKHEGALVLSVVPVLVLLAFYEPSRPWAPA